MNKDIEWANAEIKKVRDLLNNKRYEEEVDDLTTGVLSGLNKALNILDQLDEPETLSKYWIEQKLIEIYVDTLSGEVQVTFRLDDLESLLVPELELPVIPKFVADAIEVAKMAQLNYYDMLKTLEKEAVQDRTRSWVFNSNLGTFAKAWLYGYQVEEEQKYHAKIKGWELFVDFVGAKYWGVVSTGNRLGFVSIDNAKDRTKDEWNKLGINDDNADFVPVEELE